MNTIIRFDAKFVHLRAERLEHREWRNDIAFDAGQRHGPRTAQIAREMIGLIAELAGELGDLILQVLFYSQMASEQNTFSIDDVLDRLANKLIGRHPHVFGDVKADTPAEVLRNWEALKAEEKKKEAAE